MLMVVTHIVLLLAQQVCGQTSASGGSDGGGEIGALGNTSDDGILAAEARRLVTPMQQCIGVMRGILITAGIHLEPRVMAIAQCPQSAPSDLATLCSADVHVFPPETGSVSELQNQLLSKINVGGRRALGKHLNLAIRKVSPLADPESGDIYANIYCAQCHNILPNKRISHLPKKLLCDRMNGVTKCFVEARMPKNVRFCEGKTASPRFTFTWDSIFELPEEDEEYEEKTLTESVFEIAQWCCCAFSMMALILAICVFSTSARLRTPLPGKTMIALCSTLLGALSTFLLGSGVMDSLTEPLRPMCVIFAWLLQMLLLSAFVWMAIFAVELFRTFGLTRIFQRFLLCHFCRKAKNSRTNATSMMLQARGSDPNPTHRFKCQMSVASLFPLCFAIPALTINEYVHRRLKPLYEATANGSWSPDSQEAELGSTLYRLNPGFCPVNDPNYAWFTGHHVALVAWFLGPAGVMICFNLLALIIVCIQICRLKRETRLLPSPAESQDFVHRRPSKSLIAVCAKLAVILGVSWFIQLLAGLWSQLEILRRIAGLVNSAQGGIIAVSMLAGSKARRVMARRLPIRCREALGVSEPTSRSTQELTAVPKPKARPAGEANSRNASPLPTSARPSVHVR